MWVRSVIPVLIVMLSGCVVIEDDVTRSSFGSPPGGLNNVDIETVTNGYGSVTLVSGTDEDGAAAFATLITNTTGLPLLSSDITYTGSYEVIGIENIENVIDLFGPDYIRGNTFSDSGTLTLNADVSNSTLNGSDGTLTVFGSISGSDLDGSVTYDGQAGQLEGVIFVEGGVAAFHGNDNDRVFSGGLIFED